MITAMILAHLVGDYILQWDSLAIWKSRELKGVFVHSLVILATTWGIAAIFDPGFWPWVLFIWVLHLAIDAVPILITRRSPKLMQGDMVALWRLIIDQTAHAVVILLALLGSGYLTMPSLISDMLMALNSNRTLAFILGYAAITMPSWVLIEFFAFGLISGTAPDFSKATNKYVSTLERGLIMTCVLLGQFILVPLVTVPRLVFEGPQVRNQQYSTLYLTKLLASIALAVAIGLILRQL